MPAPSTRELNKIWDEVNAQMFNGELRRPHISVGPCGDDVSSIFAIDMNRKPPRLDLVLSPDLFKGRFTLFMRHHVKYTMLHEGIHQYLWQKGIDEPIWSGDTDTGRHCAAFRKLERKLLRKRDDLCWAEEW